MSYDLFGALRCFEENIRLFANPQTEREKFNLYNGLANLTDGIMRIEQEVVGLRQEVRQIYTFIRK